MKGILYKFVSSINRTVSIMRGYKKSSIAGFNFRLSHESSHFNESYNFREKMAGADFVRWTDMVQMQIYINLLSRLNNPVVVDVGAHHGLYALLAGAVCKELNQGKVFAFEPVTGNYDILQKNIALNCLEQWVKPLKKAVGKSCQYERITCSGSQSQLVSDNLANSEIVEQVTLTSELPHDLTHIDILLIDVEGAELPVLQGIPWDRTQVMNIFCEFHPYAWKKFGYSAQEMADFLKSQNYRAYDMFQEDQTLCASEHYVGPTLFKKGDSVWHQTDEKGVPPGTYLTNEA